MYEDNYEESSPVMSRKGAEVDGGEVLNKLIHLMDKTTFRQRKFRRNEDIYKNRIRNDVKDLDVLDSEDVRSGYHYLYSRYEELGDYIWKLDGYVRTSLGCIKKLKHVKDLSSALSKPFNVLSQYLYLKENFEDHQKARQQQLERTIHFFDKIENVDDLRDYYDFLRERYIEFQQYNRMQEENLQICKDILDEMSPFEEDEQEEVGIDENCDEYFERSNPVSSITIEYEEMSEYDQDGFYSDRSAYEEQNESPIPDEASPSPSPLPGSPSPVHQHQSSRMPRPPPPRRAVVPEDIKKKGFAPIPSHVVSQTRVARESKVKIFKEKLPNYNKVIGSTGYGKNTRRAPLYVRKPSVVLPPLQNTQYQSRQPSSNELLHQDFLQYKESFAIKRSTIKGIVKPNLIRKDLMKLRDSTVRPRAPKQTVVTKQEVVVRGSIRREQELVLPRIPQPPPKVNNNRIPASMGSRIPRLPAIQQNQGVSGIPRPCPPPQPPMMSRSRARASHRRYVARETGLPFPKRQ